MAYKNEVVFCDGTNWVKVPELHQLQELEPSKSPLLRMIRANTYKHKPSGTSLFLSADGPHLASRRFRPSLALRVLLAVLTGATCATDLPTLAAFVAGALVLSLGRVREPKREVPDLQPQERRPRIRSERAFIMDDGNLAIALQDPWSIYEGRSFHVPATGEHLTEEQAYNRGARLA